MFPYHHDYPYIDLHEIDLAYLQTLVAAIEKNNKQLLDWKATHEEEYQELKAFIDAVESGNFPDSIRNAFSEWMEENALDLVGELVHMVFFGLTDEGYFVAYIPESWDDITFNTTEYDISVELMPDYGHLVLSY